LKEPQSSPFKKNPPLGKEGRIDRYYWELNGACPFLAFQLCNLPSQVDSRSKINITSEQEKRKEGRYYDMGKPLVATLACKPLGR